MTKTDVAKLLTLMSGFDKRKVDDLTVEAWYLIPAIRDGDYEQAKDAVIAHVTGPSAGEYLEVRHIIGYVMAANRQTKELIASDVRAARARGLVEKTWPESSPVPQVIREKLDRLRSEARSIAERNPAAIEGSWSL